MIAGCRLVKFPKIKDHRGNLTFIESAKHIPFEIKRIYYLYDVPAAEVRGGHAHKELEQIIIALSGSFDVILDNGVEKAAVTLNRPWEGLYIPRLVWRELENFSSGAVCLVLASQFYDENDYYRNYDQFLSAVSKGVNNL
ncbi:MAG: FdtA/QdtA family cupin domain-containing protein [Candidatus Bathyarchaeia archaeon]